MVNVRPAAVTVAPAAGSCGRRGVEVRVEGDVVLDDAHGEGLARLRGAGTEVMRSGVGFVQVAPKQSGKNSTSSPACIGVPQAPVVA